MKVDQTVPMEFQRQLRYGCVAMLRRQRRVPFTGHWVPHCCSLVACRLPLFTFVALTRCVWILGLSTSG